MTFKLDYAVGLGVSGCLRMFPGHAVTGNSSASTSASQGSAFLHEVEW